MSGDDLSRMSGEDRLIAEYFRPLATAPGAMGLRDDAAFFTPPDGHDLVLTKDALVAGVHFFADDPPDTIAQKALRVNISDLAAKGAEPAGFLLALALDGTQDAAWLTEFSRGLASDAREFGCALYGGDTVKTRGPLTISITAFGTLPRGTMVHREGARVGDRVFVCGLIGDAALGLKLRREPSLAEAWGLRADEAEHLVSCYRVPKPRARLASEVRAHATASMDVSDGLVGDLAKLCRASSVSSTIDAAKVPISDAAGSALSREPSLLPLLFTGGDDYAILCTIPVDRCEAFAAAGVAARSDVHEIGVIVAGDAPPCFVGKNGKAMSFRTGSFSHF